MSFAPAPLAFALAAALCGCVDPFPDIRSALNRVDVGVRDALVDPPDRAVDMTAVDAAPPDEECNGVDDDRDGRTDEEVPIRLCPLQAGVCANTRQPCLGAAGYGNCTYSDAAPPFEPDERRCDEADNDCDGTVDEGCTCMAGEDRLCGSDVGACEQGRQFCSREGRWGPCGNAIAPEDEICDGLDNDCDGRTDEVAADECETEQAGRCAKGREICTDGVEICAPLEAPGPEICNAEDDDCDGTTDEETGGGDCDTNRLGACAAGRLICAQGRPRCTAVVSPVDEVAGDGIDNDCDGETDERIPPRFDLADLAVGGVGAVPGQGAQIIPLDGAIEPGGFQPAPTAFLNGAFSPSSLGRTPIDTDGTTFDFSPEVMDEQVGQPLAKGPIPPWDGPPTLPDYGLVQHSIIELRPNTGLTFDVGDLGRVHAATPRRLTLRFGNLAADGITGMILFDGVRRYSSAIPLNDELDVDLQLNPGVRRISVVIVGGPAVIFEDRRTYVGDATVHYDVAD